MTALFTVTKTWQKPDGTPYVGAVVRFRAQNRLTDAQTGVNVPAGPNDQPNQLNITLDADGHMSHQFYAGWYTVKELFGNYDSYPVEITADGELPTPTLPLPDPPSLYWTAAQTAAADAVVLAEALAADSGGGGGSGLPADASGWLHNNGTGTLAYTTPTAAQVGADLVGAAATEAARATSAENALSSAITTEAGTRATADTTNANAITTEASTARAAEATKVAKAGDTMSGDLAMGSHRVTGLADPSANQDAATKAWTSAQITALVNGAPGILDTLGEIATALQADESTAATLATTVAGKLAIAQNLGDLSNAATARTNLGVPAGSGTSTGTNTGDQTLPTTLPPNGAAGGDLSGTYPNPGVAKLNGTSLAGLGTGLLKNTTGTGVPSIAVAADIPNIAESQVTNLVTDLAAKQPLDSDLTAIAALTPSDGQILQWSTASSAWVLANPSGTSEAGYAENNTGTTQASLTSSTVDVTNCSESVAASARPVYLHGYYNAFATVAPTNGAPGALLTEVSNGVDTPVTMGAFIPVTSVANKTALVAVPPTRLASSTARTRSFKLQAVIPTTGTWTIENGSNNRRSLIAAEVR